jgi:hypothetical protein
MSLVVQNEVPVSYESQHRGSAHGHRMKPLLWLKYCTYILNSTCGHSNHQLIMCVVFTIPGSTVGRYQCDGKLFGRLAPI